MYTFFNDLADFLNCIIEKLCSVVVFLPIFVVLEKLMYRRSRSEKVFSFMHRKLGLIETQSVFFDGKYFSKWPILFINIGRFLGISKFLYKLCFVHFWRNVIKIDYFIWQFILAAPKRLIAFTPLVRHNRTITYFLMVEVLRHLFWATRTRKKMYRHKGLCNAPLNLVYEKGK